MGWVIDTLWVFDIAERRVTFVAPDGRVLRTVSLPASVTRGAAFSGTTRKLFHFTSLAIHADGSMFGEGSAVGAIPGAHDPSLFPSHGHRPAATAPLAGHRVRGHRSSHRSLRRSATALA